MKVSLLLARPSDNVSSRQFPSTPSSVLNFSLSFPSPHDPTIITSAMHVLQTILTLFIESILVGYPTLVFRRQVLLLTVRLDLNSSELWDQVRIRFCGYLLPGLLAVVLLALLDPWLEPTVERLTVNALEVVSLFGE